MGEVVVVVEHRMTVITRRSSGGGGKKGVVSLSYVMFVRPPLSDGEEMTTTA